MAAIWIIDPLQLNRLNNLDKLQKTSEALLQNHDYIAIDAYHTEERMSRQSAEFIIHNSRDPLNEAPIHSAAIQEKLIIKAELKPDILNTLQKFGIENATLLGDLDHIASSNRQR